MAWFEQIGNYPLLVSRLWCGGSCDFIACGVVIYRVWKTWPCLLCARRSTDIAVKTCGLGPGRIFEHMEKGILKSWSQDIGDQGSDVECGPRVIDAALVGSPGVNLDSLDLK